MIEQSRARYGLWAALLILAGTAGRLWFVATGQLNLVQDEAQYWDWTRHLQLTYYSKGPLIAWIITAGTTLFGNTELGVRFGSIAGSALAQVLLYLGVARLWKRPAAALWTLVVFNSMPLFLALGILMTTDNPFVYCWTGALFCLWAAGEGDGRGGSRGLPFALLALCLGVGILAKYTMLGFIGLAVLYGLYLDWKGWRPRGFWVRLAAASMAGLALGFLPTLIWNVQNDFVGYKHVLYLIGVEGKQAERLLRLDRFPEYFGSQVGLATPWWLWLMLAGGVESARRAWKALRVASEEAARTARLEALLCLLFWPLWLFLLLWSFHTKVLPNWTTVSYVGGALLAALRFEGLARKPKNRRSRNAILAASAFFFLLLHLSPLLPLPDKLNPTHRLKGWESLGEKLSEIQRTQLADSRGVFLFSDVYDMTAALAFYGPGQPRTYCAWLDDRRMNQYDLWPGPEALAGFDAIFVVKGFRPTTNPELSRLFARVETPILFQSTFNGVPAREFTLVICRNYNGTWPRNPSGKF